MGHRNDAAMKEAARRLWGDAPQAGEVYRHYKGGLYTIVCSSLQEETLELLVTYRSNANGVCWTRTLVNFRELIDDGGNSVTPRFWRFVARDS